MTVSRRTPGAFVACLVLGAVLIPASRLPHILGGNMIPDGDECIVGLMGKHMLEGKRFPIFFYGQSYGLSFFETATAAAFFGVFGVSTLSLKAAMLALWSVGWLLLVLAVRRFGDTRAAAIAALALVLSPAWGVWSMKARGGYISAFALTNLCLYLVARICDGKAQKKATCALLGVCVALVYLCQPLWLAGVVPFLILMGINRRKIPDFGALVVGVLGTMLLVLVVTADARSTYWSPAVFGNPDFLQNLRLLPHRVWVGLSGAFYYNQQSVPGFFTGFCATLWLASVPIGLCAHLWFGRGGTTPPLPRACVLSMVAVATVSLFVNADPFFYRYMLPLSAFLVIFISIELGRAFGMNGKGRIAAIISVGALAVSGGLSLVEFRDLAPVSSVAKDGVKESYAMDRLIDELVNNGYEHVYCCDPMLQWNLMFASGERIKARWRHPLDRLPECPLAVDAALRAGRRVAVVGTAAEMRPMAAFLREIGYAGHGPRLIENRYLLLPDPTVDLVRRLGFRLNE